MRNVCLAHSVHSLEKHSRIAQHVSSGTRGSGVLALALADVITRGPHIDLYGFATLYSVSVTSLYHYYEDCRRPDQADGAIAQLAAVMSSLPCRLPRVVKWSTVCTSLSTEALSKLKYAPTASPSSAAPSRASIQVILIASPNFTLLKLAKEELASCRKPYALVYSLSSCLDCTFRIKVPLSTIAFLKFLCHEFRPRQPLGIHHSPATCSPSTCTAV
mmetsp:Transcript_26154/g.54948  ORF Transcript_26154/g.54948 Transcript_26154/m.54948 type:complete len:217 (+) Transcript_26154:1133-1783(+)